MRILFLSRWFPFPPDNGSKLRIYNLLQALVAEYKVTLVSFVDDLAQGTRLPDEIGERFEQVHVVPWKPFNPKTVTARLGFLSPTPRSVIDTRSPAMEKQIEESLAANLYDVVIASQFDMAVYSSAFRHVPAIFEEVEVGVLYDQYTEAPTAAERLRRGLTWAKHRRYLSRLVTDFAACTVVSERERELLARATPTYDRVTVVPNCIAVQEDLDRLQDCKDANSLIFTGSFSYEVNYEGMLWFVSKVYPLVREAVPDVRLTITGDHANRPFPADASVHLTGYVDDVQSLVARSCVSLAPLFTGGGTRLKILEAMALRTAVVSTTKGAEGLDIENGRHLFVADDPEQFAAAIVRVLSDPECAAHVAEQAHRLVWERYSCQATIPQFMQLVEAVAKK